MDMLLGMDWVDAGVSLVGVVLGALAGHVAGGSRARQGEARAARSGSAVELRVALRNLRDVTRRWGRSAGVAEEDVRAALSEWDQVLEFHRHRVPRELMRALWSVRSAAGEVFGPVVLAYVVPQFEKAPLGERDQVWQDLLVDYVGYLYSLLGRWGDGEPGAETGAVDFDTWRKRRSELNGEAA